MAANASHEFECGFTNSTLSIIDQLHFLSYVVLNQIYLILGVGGNIILLIAFYKQSKTEKAYAYQVILTVSKTLETFSFSVFLTTLKRFSGAENQKADWFVYNYGLMYLTARLGPVAHMVFIISSLLLTVSMSADRLFALTKPFIYKDIKRSRHQAIAAVVCFGIGVASSVSDAWRYKVVTEGDHYTMTVDAAYVSSDAAHIGAHVRTGLRVVGVLGMIILNIAIAVIFRTRSKKVGQMRTNEQKGEARKAADRTLFLLNIYQSILMAINQIPHMGYHILAYSIPSFTACAGIVYSPTADAMVMLTDSADLFVLMAANKRMRRMVVKVLPCMKYCSDVSSTIVQSVSMKPTARKVIVAQQFVTQLFKNQRP